VQLVFDPIVPSPFLTLNIGMTRHLLNVAFALCVCSAAVMFLQADGANTFSVNAQVPAKSQVTNSEPAQHANVWATMEEYFAALAKDRRTNVTALGQQILTQATNDWNALSFFSWRIFNDRGIRQWDRALALAAAERAAQLTAEKEPTVLDTYARALWENDRRADAIKFQRKAVEICNVEAKRIDMEANLNRYLRLSKEGKR
jgi:hypothetical protein